MSSPVAELDAGLQAMLSLKPPGVTGSRIQSITTLCTENVQVSVYPPPLLCRDAGREQSSENHGSVWEWKLGRLFILDPSILVI